MSSIFRVMASAAAEHKIYPVADKWLQTARRTERDFDHLFMYQYLKLSMTKSEHAVEPFDQILILDNMIQHIRFYKVQVALSLLPSILTVLFDICRNKF
jgi:hypothetical protein